MLIAVTGGTGFVGRSVVAELLGRGHNVRVLARNRPADEGPPGLTWHKGSVVTGEGLEAFLDGSDAVVHLVGIIRESGSNTFEAVHHGGTVKVVSATRKAGISRYLHMSALGTRVKAVSDYHRTKWAGEEAVRASGLDFTIFRPSIIYGPGDAFVNMLAGTMRRSPIMPVVGGGKNPMQPVYVNDVAQAFANALDRPETVGKVYELGGPGIVTLMDILNIISETIGKKEIFIPIPMVFVKPAVSLLEDLRIKLPVTTDQLIMLGEDNVRKGGDNVDELGVEWTGFEEGIRQYLGPGA